MAVSSLRKRRSSIFKFVWSYRQLLANVGAVLSLLDGPQGCDPAYCIVWFRFRMVRTFLAYRPIEVGGGYRLLDMVREGCHRHGPVHLVVASATDIGFRCLLERVRGQLVPCRFFGGPDGDGRLCWGCTFSPLVEIRENPEFHDLMKRVIGLDVCFGMGGFLYFLERMELLFWQSLLLKEPAICWSMFLELSLRSCSLTGVCLMSLMLPMLRCGYLIILMFGRMVALFLTRSPVSPRRVLGSILTVLARGGDLAGGDILMTSVLLVALLIPVEASAPYMVLFGLYTEQSSGCYSCPAGV